MNIENEIFKGTSVIFDNLEKNGFKKERDFYVLEKNFLSGDFKAIIKIDYQGEITTKIIDLQVGEEYINIRTNMTGEFVNKVRKSYKEILINIRNHCFEKHYFIFDQANRINKYIKQKYNDEPEFLWDKFPRYGVYRNKNNNKWYGIIMNLDLCKLCSGTGEVEIIDVKLGKNKVKELLKQEGFYKAYHMNKTDWISILLNDTIKDSVIISLLDESYNLIDKTE